ILWTGLEYFRSELYFLKFSWFSAGYLWGGHPGLLPVGTLGVYGCGFVIFLFIAFLLPRKGRAQVIGMGFALAVLAGLANIRGKTVDPAGRTLKIAGIQLEFPPDLSIPNQLDLVLEKFPDTELLVLSEYTFDGTIPKRVRDWCRENKRYLAAGGRREADIPGEYFNTAFVVGPSGEMVFEQGKSVPIQFFKDGLPALERKVWESPWGKIAICVCYDLSYRSVTDQFMKQGAQALIVPFMDVSNWGRHQHALHARVAPLRAREYQIPVFRLGSSGISQIVDRHGYVVATAPYPGEGEIIGGQLQLSTPARLPFDTFLAPACSTLTGLFLLWLLLARICRRLLPESPIFSSSSKVYCKVGPRRQA
ncbi:MAG TPA: nitrilase-related carbon-nitrogen hydrolase, partial [Verrucomicrobiae bacterium]|nr:nitrilase-related carbon-nitrogen hydrolase [Verrucomicrobiae bacterium]